VLLQKQKLLEILLHHLNQELQQTLHLHHLRKLQEDMLFHLLQDYLEGDLREEYHQLHLNQIHQHHLHRHHQSLQRFQEKTIHRLLHHLLML
jgi:hypothetical protein